MGVTAAIAVGGAYLQSENAKTQAKYNSAIANANARLLDMQGDRANEKGARDASAYGKQLNKITGTQRTAFAAQGVDISSGSAAEVVQDTATIGAQDMMTIKNNAALEAWGFKTQAIDMRAKGEMGEIAASNAFKNSLVTGGLQAYQASGGMSSWGSGGSSKGSPAASSGNASGGTGYLGGNYSFTK